LKGSVPIATTWDQAARELDKLRRAARRVKPAKKTNLGKGASPYLDTGQRGWRANLEWTRMKDEEPFPLALVRFFVFGRLSLVPGIFRISFFGPI
jgi:hypothetical protein